MSFVRAVLCLVGIVGGCSSSEADAGAVVDTGTAYDHCGPQSYCCKDGAAVQSQCRPHDAGADTDADGPCDAGKACCCDVDVAVAPTCSEAGLACSPPYRLVMDCAACVLYPDGEPAPDSDAE